jgi:hypothetical protein
MRDRIETELTAALAAAAGEDALRWLESARGELAAAADPHATLERLFGAARRKLGKNPVAADAVSAGVPLIGWQASDVGRALLLVAASAQAESAAVVGPLFRNGDESERSSIVRSLALLPEPQTLKPIALEVGRVNSAALFGALALDNPYPAAHYTDHELNQLVLKTMFMGLSVGAVLGLEQRANTELARMCGDFYDERTAAGRSVPVDIWLAMVPHALPARLALAKQHLSHADPAQRFHAAVALSRRAARDPAIGAWLAERGRLETDQRVLAALKHELAAARA